jgi:hypothetical protein
VLSIGAISSVWAAKPASPVDENVFARPRADDPQGQDGAARATKDAKPTADKADAAKGGAKVGARKLKPAQLHEVQELADRDRQVRAHEAAHQSAAGSLGGGASFTYQTGPDGKSYAVGGEVPVDMSAGRTPEETISRAAQIRAAALAPADPSPQDLAVAAAATAMEAAARQEMSRQQLAALKSAAANARASAPAKAPHHEVEMRLLGSGRAEAAEGGQKASSTVETTTAPVVSDAGEMSAAVATALETSRANAGPSLAQLQQVARLASMAYRAGTARTW